MSFDIVIYALSSCACALVLAVLYINFWKRTFGLALVPTGYGLILPFFWILTGYLAEFPSYLQLASLCLLLATLIYWFDDLFGLKPLIRMFLSIVSGAIIFIGLTNGSWSPNALALLVGAALLGVLGLFVLTTMINFYDGADLNVSVLIGLTTLSILASSLHSAVPVYFLALVTFGALLGFVCFNRKPKVLYLGDTGCFATAGFILISFLEITKGTGHIPVYLVLPLTLPLIDVIYVIFLRLRRGENLMTRNRLHLYQVMQRCTTPFAYLLPQLVNVFVGIGVLEVLKRIGLFHMPLIAISIVTTAIITYFVMRHAVSPRGEDIRS